MWALAALSFRRAANAGVSGWIAAAAIAPAIQVPVIVFLCVVPPRTSAAAPPAQGTDAASPSFWAAVIPQVRERHPDAWFVGEVIHGDYRAFVTESGLDSVTQYAVTRPIAGHLFTNSDGVL